MDNDLIVQWNKRVYPDDTVYHLGDLTLKNSIADVIFQLNGNIRILSTPWHHDRNWLKTLATKQLVEFGKIELLDSIVVLDDKIKYSVPIILCHYAFEIWDRKHYDSIHFHGHSHGELHRIHNRLDVGVDMAYKLLGYYSPFSLHEAISLANGYYEGD
jgi:calcineurin-like phosphoesterase family protein